MQERVGEARELSFLYGSGVGGCDDMDGGQQVGPWWRTSECIVVCDAFFFEVVSSYVDDLIPTICEIQNQPSWVEWWLKLYDAQSGYS